jgi:hypothetical protein
MPLASAQALKTHAENAAFNTQGAEFAELSGLMCWSAVIRCALNAGAITPLKAQLLERLDWKEDFSKFIAPSDTRVRNADDMRKVPAGAFIAFIRVDPPDPFFKFFNIHKGKRHIVHAMLSLGNGLAAGNKNSCVGIGHHVGWERLNLADDLNWRTNGHYDAIDAINGHQLNVQASLPLRIRYRELAKFQDDAQGPKPARSAKIQTLAPDKTVLVKPGEIWDVGPLSDCVALAAIKPHHSLTTKKATSMFLWHVNGGWVNQDTIPYKALSDFLGEGNADWVFVHGRSAGKQGHRTFQGQSFEGDLVEGRAGMEGHVVRSYSGSSLLIDSTGNILNDDDLTLL